MPDTPNDAVSAAGVVFQPWGLRCPAAPGQDLLTVAQASGVQLVSGCGGVGTCGECVVRIVKGLVSEPADEEYEWLSPQDRAAGLRLACLTQPLEGGSDLVVDVPPGSRIGDQPSQTDAVGITLPSGSAATAGSPSGGARRLGVAVDLGTTGLATYLIDVADGRTLAARGAPNPQIAYGEDVMSRLAVAISDPARTARMRRALSTELNRLIGLLCLDVGASRGDLTEAVVVGNTAMHHLFFGLPVERLAWAPYEPADASERTAPAKDVGLVLAPGATVYSPPVVAGFVGSDHLAMLLSSGVASPRDVTLYLDVGTNTEISLVTAGSHWTCSAASGPAFEGAHIAAGMRAASGAIDSVRWGVDGLTVTTIDGAPAVGICGSGLLDAVAVLRDQGALTAAGRLLSGHPLVHGSGRAAYIALDGSGGDATHAVRLSRRDVGEVQMAKAAVRAGLKLLTESAGIQESDIARVVLAGAFGTHLDVFSAQRIGLIPRTGAGTVFPVGNGAGAGACLLLAGADARSAAIALANRITYLELTGHPDFQDRFTQALALTDDPWAS